MTRSLLYISLLAVACLAGTALGQDAPTFPDKDEAQTMPPTAQKKVDGYIDYWAARLKSDKTEDQAKASQLLVLGFQAHAIPLYQGYFAKSATARLLPLLTGDRTRQNFAAMALKDMTTPDIQPALEAMSRNENAAVRYWAVKGYVPLAPAIMTGGGENAKTMLATLERLGIADRADGATLGTIFRALLPSPDAKPAQVTDLRKLLAKIWLARLADVVAGDAEVIRAYQRIIALPLEPLNNDDKKAVMRLLLEALDAAAKGMLKNAGKEDLVRLVVPKNATKGDLVGPYPDLLVTAEEQLGKLAEVTERPVAAAITGINDGTKIDIPALKVQLALNDTWKAAMKKLDVTPREIPQPTSAPTTSGPTSKPTTTSTPTATRPTGTAPATRPTGA
jgi:hypothetical protein